MEYSSEKISVFGNIRCQYQYADVIISMIFFLLGLCNFLALLAPGWGAADRFPIAISKFFDFS